MITNKPFGKDFDILFDELLALSYSNRPIKPSEEPAINVYLNDRTIDLPSTFKEIAVQGDHHAERVWFAVDRYFDGEDLSEKTWIVQFINAKGEAAVSSLTVKAGGAFQDDEVDKNTLRLGWDITQDVTKEAGIITFSLRCFTLDERSREITFNLGTEPVTAIVTRGLMISADSENLILKRDELSELVDRIEALYDKYYGTATNISYENIIRDSLPKIDDVVLYGGRDREHSSLDFKCADYNNLKNKPVINVDGKDYVVGGEEPIVVSKVEVLQSWNAESDKPVANKAIAGAITEQVNNTAKTLQDQINLINEELGSMTYIPLKILSFINNINYLEKNTVFNGDIKFDWDVEGTVATQSIAKGTVVVNIDNSENRTYTGNFGEIKDTTDFILTVADKKGNPTKATSKIIFAYKVFYGAAAAPEEDYTSDFIINLENSSLQETKETTFTINAENEYIYFALPQSYGTPSFSVGGFTGGFGETPVGTVLYNETNYDIWKSDNMITATNREVKVV